MRVVLEVRGLALCESLNRLKTLITIIPDRLKALLPSSPLFMFLVFLGASIFGHGAFEVDVLIVIISCLRGLALCESLKTGLNHMSQLSLTV